MTFFPFLSFMSKSIILKISPKLAHKTKVISTTMVKNSHTTAHDHRTWVHTTQSDITPSQDPLTSSQPPKRPSQPSQ